MDTGMFLTGIIYYFCLFMGILVSLVGAGIFLEKRLSPSSWSRNLFAVIAGIGTSVTSLLIVYAVSSFASFHRSSLFLIPVSVVLGSMLGGYIGGKVARQNELIYGFLIGCSMLLLSPALGESDLNGRQIDNLDVVLMQAARFFATVVGSYFALFQRERNQSNLTTKE